MGSVPLPLADPTSHNWRQGVGVPLSLPGLDIEALGLAPLLTEDDLLLVISHDCDICHDSVAEEPYVEVIAARLRERADDDGNFMHGKNPRQVRFWASRSEERHFFEARMTDRRLISKRLLSDTLHKGEAVLDTQTTRMLRRWLGRRYWRPSLPHEFDKRFRDGWAYIRNRLKKNHEVVTAIYVDLSPPDEELPPDRKYTVITYVVIPTVVREDAALERQATAVAAAFQTGFAKCEGIVCHSVRVVSEAELTLEDLQQLTQWDYSDHLSYSD